jgi:hypothetical protein
MIEPAIAEAISSGAVPASISASYLMENRNHPAEVAIVVVTVITFFVVSLRCCSRVFLVKGFGLDDALAVLSLVCPPPQ